LSQKPTLPLKPPKPNRLGWGGFNGNVGFCDNAVETAPPSRMTFFGGNSDKIMQFVAGAVSTALSAFATMLLRPPRLAEWHFCLDFRQKCYSGSPGNFKGIVANPDLHG